MEKQFEKMSVQELHNGLKNNDFTSVEVSKFFLDKSKKEDLNAYLEVFDDVLEQAKIADDRIKKGDISLLTGIPIAIKDNILIKDRKVSAASKILENYVATYDANVIKKLKDEGVVFLGRTNMDEFAMGASTEYSAFGPAKNPHDNARVPGGSSGGSAISVSGGLAPIALGSDTAGSIRQPAAFCGCVGLKPTYGSVSRSGLIAMGSSLDSIGSFGKSVHDVEAVFNVIDGNDDMDSTSVPIESRKDVPVPEKMTIGVPVDFISKGVDSDILEEFNSTLEDLEKAGHTIKKIDLPHVKYSVPAYYVIIPAEASTNLSRFDGVRYGLSVDGVDLLEDYNKSRGAGFGPEVRRRILLGAYVLSAGYFDSYYGKATEVRKLISKDYIKAFEHVDVIATPTTPTPAFKIGEIADPVSMYLADIFTVPANIVGLPGISIPMGVVKRGESQLPIGFQLMAPHFGEKRLFALGKVVESL